MSVDSPNLEGLDSWAFEPRKVDKPWGHELIWAEGDRYVGKVLFIKAGDGAYMPYSQQVDGVMVGNNQSRRKLAAEAGRRPRFLNRRKPGMQPDA